MTNFDGHIHYDASINTARHIDSVNIAHPGHSIIPKRPGLSNIKSNDIFGDFFFLTKLRNFLHVDSFDIIKMDNDDDQYYNRDDFDS